MNDLG
jgi:stress response protein SCP2